MISDKSFSVEWIENLCEKYKIRDKGILDKYLHALSFIEWISLKTDCVLKGGTAVTLLSNVPLRFSIDVDVILKRDDIEDILDDIMISNDNVFIRYEKDIRKTNLSIPKEHYKVYYPSIYGREDYIILDILKEDVVYSNIDKMEITSEFIYKEENNDIVKVRIPSCEDLLGDKLTAFAPNTTGIPYYKKDRDRGMEINKQLFDIGYLFDYVKDIGIVRETFLKTVEKEISYRKGKDISLEMVMEDIFNTSLLILNTKNQSRERQILLSGRKKLSGYIWNKKGYPQEKFFINAAKTAYLIMLIKKGANNIEKYKTGFDKEIEGEYRYFNKIKKISDEAFFYLYKAVELWK